MTRTSEAQMMHDRGTKLMELKPSSIVGAADGDLKRRKLKGEGDEEPRAHYAFHRRHVQRASTAAELIRLAIEGRDLGLVSGKLNTRIIYRDLPKLREALAIAETSA